MNRVVSFIRTQALGIVVLGVCSHILVSAAAAEESGRYITHKRVIQGFAVTGHNDILGSPFFDWGPPFGSFGFVTLGIYNEGGDKALPINSEYPADSLVATTLDPRILIPNDVTEEDYDPSWVNVPLRKVETTLNYHEKISLPSIHDAEPSEKAQVGGDDPITIGQWMEANGTANVVCYSDGYSKLRIRMKDLIPMRLYAVWATLGPSKRGDQEVFPSLPVGGLPNLFVTDDEGNFTFERELQFCPLTPESTDRAMLVINVQMHSDHQNYGAINGPPLPREGNGYWIGTVIHNHLQFPVTATLLD